MGQITLWLCCARILCLECNLWLLFCKLLRGLFRWTYSEYGPNDKWLEKQDPNNQLVSLWCSWILMITWVRALLGMVSFYKAVIKYLHDNLPLENELLKALTCLNPREQNSSKSKEYCKTVASAMPCITGDEKVSWRWMDQISRNWN